MSSLVAVTRWAGGRAYLPEGSSFSRDHMRGHCVGTDTSHGIATPAADALPLRRSIALTLTNPALWSLALALGLLNANRYGFLDWGITHVTEMHPGTSSVGEAAIEYAVLPAGGILGALVSGWASDRYCVSALPLRSSPRCGAAIRRSFTATRRSGRAAAMLSCRGRVVCSVRRCWWPRTRISRSPARRRPQWGS